MFTPYDVSVSFHHEADVKMFQKESETNVTICSCTYILKSQNKAPSTLYAKLINEVTTIKKQIYIIY